jgi:hypothetical protein
MLFDRPHITAEVTFLRTEEGGRVQAPTFPARGRYMPHIVVQGRGVRRAVIDADRTSREPYQGVAFLEGPSGYRLGESACFVLELMYYPNHRYIDVQPGATFTVREGPKIVAHGVVLTRTDPDDARPLATDRPETDRARHRDDRAPN